MITEVLHRARLGLLTALFVLLAVAPAVAEDFVLGAEDVVQVSVWRHPELERSLTVNADGNVVLPPVGEIKAAGLTAKQLGDRIADRLSSYLRETASVTVTVSQFLSQSVVISGAVAKPGRYGFERMPSLVDALGAAGGALTQANLAAVQIVRREGDTRRTLTVDVASALALGETSALPALQAGDGIVVPAASETGGAVNGEGVAVLGEVIRPGLFTVGAGQDLWAVLAQAGGATPRGNLSEVRLLTRTDTGHTVTTLNLRQVLDRGSRGPTTLHAGDVLVILPKGSTWSAFLGVLGLSQNALNVAVLVEYFRNNRAGN